LRNLQRASFFLIVSFTSTSDYNDERVERDPGDQRHADAVDHRVTSHAEF
jgi:hypothetical protein